MTGTISSHNLESLSLEDSFSIFFNGPLKKEKQGDFVVYDIGFTFKMHDLVHDLTMYVASVDFRGAIKVFVHYDVRIF
ncbi:hypothetical protein RYX36_007676 [Vicia faba]